MNRSELNPTNRILSWYREKTIGYDFAAEYRRPYLGQDEEILVIDGVSERIEREVVKHEINHYKKHGEDSESEFPDYVMIAGGVMMIPASAGVVPQIWAKIGGAVAILGFFLALYWIVFKHEDEANEDVDLGTAFNESEIDMRDRFSKRYLRFVNIGEKTIAMTTMIPGNMLKISGLYLRKIASYLPWKGDA